MAKTSVQFYYDYVEQLEDLDDKQFRNVVLAMVKYDEENEIIKLDQVSKMAFNFIKKRIDYDKTSYDEKCRKNKENIQNYWNKRKQINTNEYERIPMYTKNTDIDIELELDKELDIDNNTTNTTNNTNNTIYDYLEQNFGRTLNPIEYEDVAKWKDNELTRYAIKTAILNGAYSIKYITSILNSYEKNNIKTVQQAQEAEKRYKENKTKKKYNKRQTAEDIDKMFENLEVEDGKETSKRNT